MNNHVDLPVCLRLTGVPVLLVGGGTVAQQRCTSLLEVGARVTLVAPQVTWQLGAWAQEGKLTWQPRGFRQEDVVNQRLVFSATDDPEVSRAVHAHASAYGILSNAADIPHLCDFTMPSTGRRGPITVAVSTSGLAPALAAQLQRSFSSQVGQHHVQWARVQGFLRSHLPRGPRRMALLKQWVQGPVGALFVAGQRREAFASIRQDLKGWAP